MELTVGKLKQIIKGVDDNVVLAHLGIGNDKFHPFISVKRLLLLQGNEEWGNKKFLSINSMGSHFTQDGDHKYLKWDGEHYWDENTLSAETEQASPDAKPLVEALEKIRDFEDLAVSRGSIIVQLKQIATEALK